MTIQGIHHITLVCADAQRTVDFYTGVLGQRFVKKTVNFDDPGSYHLYFGDELGRPGSAITFFEWRGVPRGHPGVGGTHHFALRVAGRDALLTWKRRLTDLGLAVDGPLDRHYFTSIYFTDPDGTILEIATDGPGWTVDEAPDRIGTEFRAPPPEMLVANRDEGRIKAETWPEPVPAITADMALLRGMHHITAIGADIERTDAFFGGLLGMRRVKMTSNFDDPDSAHWYWGVGDGQPGTLITYFGRDPARGRARMGAGQTHHFALAVPDEESQLEWREKLLGAGLRVSPVMDRIYFKSIYTNDPDGHIVELATAGPGFTVDESPADLGQGLQLPPWLEVSRDAITHRLRPIGPPGPPILGGDESPSFTPQDWGAGGADGPHQEQPVKQGGVPLEQAKAAMVMLHGRGATAESILSLAAHLDRPDVAYLAPQAAQNTWYPHSFLMPIAGNEPSLSSALAAVAAVLARVETAGVPPERTIILGFSQGACLATEFAARNARRYGGVVGLSGGLIGPDGTPRDYPGALDGTPVFLGCSDVDPHIPLARVHDTAEVFRRLGADVTERIYPGMGHTVNEDEIAFVRQLMASLTGDVTMGR